MRHMIFGAGLVGGFLGGALLDSGEQVDWVVRPATAEKLAGGLRVTSMDGVEAQLTDLKIVELDDTDREPADYLWLTVKCTAVEAALEQVGALVGPETIVICLQNGLGAEEEVGAALPEQQVLRGVMAANVVEVEAGHLHRGTDGGIELPRVPQTESLQAVFRSPLLPLRLYENLPGLLWGKLQLNLNNAINALADIPLQQQLQQRGYRRVLAAAMGELLRVAAAERIELPRLTALPPAWLPQLMRLPDWLFERLARQMLAMDAEARSSMWADLSSGRRTEVDYLNGAVVRRGEALGVPCPVNRTLQRLIHDVEQGRRRQGMVADQLCQLVFG